MASFPALDSLLRNDALRKKYLFDKHFDNQNREFRVFPKNVHTSTNGPIALGPAQEAEWDQTTVLWPVKPTDGEPFKRVVVAHSHPVSLLPHGRTAGKSNEVGSALLSTMGFTDEIARKFGGPVGKELAKSKYAGEDWTLDALVVCSIVETEIGRLATQGLSSEGRPSSEVTLS